MAATTRTRRQIMSRLAGLTAFRIWNRRAKPSLRLSVVILGMFKAYQCRSGCHQKLCQIEQI